MRGVRSLAMVVVLLALASCGLGSADVSTGSEVDRSGYRYANLAGRDLRSLDLVGRDLTGAVLDGADLRGVDLTGAMGYLSVVMVVSSVGVLVVRRPEVARLRAGARESVLVGLGQGGAYSLVLLAFQRAQAGQVAGLRQVSVVLGVLIAREALGPRAAWGAVTVVVGAMLVVW